MRRSGGSRRHVLDVENNSYAWKNKYQPKGLNGIGGKVDSAQNPLSKLVGSYVSDSDGEDDNVKGKSILESKVEEFLKEVDSTKPSEDGCVITCAWQECYDEGSGYPYYWNMNTNEVTWEIPPELLAYQAAVAAQVAQSQAKVKEQAQHAQWAVEQAALGLTPEIPSATQSFTGISHKLKRPFSAANVPAAPSSGKPIKRSFAGQPSSDSEDEKIEMITSWADESEEDEEEEYLKKKASTSNRTETDTKVIVPKPPRPIPGQHLTIPPKKISKPMKPDPPPVTVYGPQLPKYRSRNGSSDDTGEPEPTVVIQKVRRLKAETDVIVGTREKGPARKKSVDRSRSGSPSDHFNSKGKVGESSANGGTAEEKLILARLCRQVQVLQDLGGEVPNDVKDLIDSETKSSVSPSAASADNIIALIEMEQPPDHKQSENYLFNLRAAEKSMQSAMFRFKSEITSNDSSKDKANDVSKPSSFALIAGYGDDSDQDDSPDSEASVSSKDKAGENGPESKAKSLFPILDHEENSQDNLSNRTNSKVIENESQTISKTSQETSLKSSLVIDHSAGQKRKKRLDVPPTAMLSLVSTNNTKENTEEVSKVSKDGKSISTSYTTSWSSTSTYTSDPTANDRRGFGFQDSNAGQEESVKPPPKPQKGKIQFIKAETVVPQAGTNVRDEGSEIPTDKPTSMKSTEDPELHQHVSSLAQLVIAKLRFLSDGKDPVSPVQAMAIQIETLMSAWNAGALTQSFLQRWLQSTGAELVELERAAAPKGWAVQWDRTYKRYFYCNLATKDTQWDYPVVPDNGQSLNETAQLETKRQPTPPPEDDEDAMELCTTPPLPEEGEEAELEEQRSPPAGNRLTTDEGDTPNIPSNERADTLHPTSLPHQPPLPSSSPPPLPSSPPPPPPDTPPPPASSPTPSHGIEHGEPLPPGVDTSEMQYLPVRTSMQQTAVSLASELGAHLPLNALQAVGSMHGAPVMSGVQVMSLQYPAGVSTTYVPPPPTEAMLASYNHATAVDYMGYMGVYTGAATAMPVASVAAPPLAYSGPTPQPPPNPPLSSAKRKEALLSELSSFYSDIASLDSNSMDGVEEETPEEASAPEPSINKPVLQHTSVVPSTIHGCDESDKAYQIQDGSQSQSVGKPVTHPSDGTPDHVSKKRKKAKLTPGLTLKKKGVSNLVAKWQQVQQEVWKDYQTLSDDGAD